MTFRRPRWPRRPILQVPAQSPPGPPESTSRPRAARRAHTSRFRNEACSVSGPRCRPTPAPESGPHLFDAGRTGPKCANIAATRIDALRIRTKVGFMWAGSGPKLAEFGVTSTDLGRAWPSGRPSRGSPRKFWADVSKHRGPQSKTWESPKVGRTWVKDVAEIESSRVELGRFRAKVGLIWARAGSNSTTFPETSADLGHTCGAKLGQDSTELGPSSPEFGPMSTRFDQQRAKLGAKSTNYGLTSTNAGRFRRTQHAMSNIT